MIVGAKKSLIKIISGGYVNVTECFLPHDWRISAATNIYCLVINVQSQKLLSQSRYLIVTPRIFRVLAGTPTFLRFSSVYSISAGEFRNNRLPSHTLLLLSLQSFPVLGARVA
jgi:hypothetical protein